MPLYDRLVGHNDAGVVTPNKIAVHQFSALLGEFARGQITGAQAQGAIAGISGAPLTASEVTEAQTLLGTITGTAVAKIARAAEINDVLILAEMGSVYPTPNATKTRLGV